MIVEVFGGFQSPEVRKKFSNNFQISIFGFAVCIVKKYRRMIKDFYFGFGL